MVAFRNLAANPADPVVEWPTEGVQAALERGDLTDWQRLAAEIGRAPWGTTARQVEEVLRHSRPYGVAELMEAVITRARERAEASERATVAAEIRDAIARSGLSQAEFATRVGTSGSRLSTYLAGKVAPSSTFMVRIRRLNNARVPGARRRPTGRESPRPGRGTRP